MTLEMSLCYDFEKWTIVSLISITIILSIGLVSLAYGQGITQKDYLSDFYRQLDMLKCVADKMPEFNATDFISKLNQTYKYCDSGL
jgi:hypothetical protein